MAGAKRKPSARKKRRSASSSSPTSTLLKRTPREIAERLGVSAATVRRWAQSGRIRATKDERGRYHIGPNAAPSSPSTTPRRAAKKPPFRKKRSSRETVAPRRKRPSSRAPSAIRSGIRAVRESTSPNLRAAAALFGISPERLRELVAAGKVRAVRDAAGALHIPGAALQAKQFVGKQRRKKRKARGRAPTPPWMTEASAPRRKKKTKRKLVPGKKKKRVRKTKPSRQRFREALVEDTGPSIHAEPAARPTEPSRAAPMPMEDAGQRLGNATRDFVMARPRWERLETGRVYHDLKLAFKKAYGERQWRDTYAWIVDEWGLEDYIFDYEALRDS